MSAERPSGPKDERALPGDRLPAAGRGGADPGEAGAVQPPVVAPGATPRISPRCTWQVVEGEAVLLDLQGKRILGLNRAGSYVFPLLDGTRTVTALAASLAEEFGIDVRRAEDDVRAFLAELASRGFVEGVVR